MLIFLFLFFIGAFVILLGCMSEFIIFIINNYTFITLPKILLLLLVYYFYSLKLEKTFISLYLGFKLNFKFLTITESLIRRFILSLIMLTFFILLNSLRQTISDSVLFILTTIPLFSLFGIATKNWFDSMFEIKKE